MFCFVVLLPVGGEHDGNIQIGVWVLTGLLTFMIIEKIFPESGEDEESEDLNSDVGTCIYVNFCSFCIKQLLTGVHVLLHVVVNIFIKFKS